MVRNASWKTDEGILEDVVVAGDGVVEGKGKRGRGWGLRKIGGRPASRFMYAVYPSAGPADPFIANASLPRLCFIFMSTARLRLLTPPRPQGEREAVEVRGNI